MFQGQQDNQADLLAFELRIAEVRNKTAQTYYSDSLRFGVSKGLRTTPCMLTGGMLHFVIMSLVPVKSRSLIINLTLKSLQF